MWDAAEEALRDGARRPRPTSSRRATGAFYGPKIDFHVTDTMGRSWQLGTCQLDFYMPERFDLAYTTAEDTEERPVMIHRAVTGLDRALPRHPDRERRPATFPLWLAPEQARVLPVSDRHAPYAEQVRERLRREGLRVEVDVRGESVGRRIRDGELAKIPYLLVVGDREAEAGHGLRARPRGGRPRRACRSRSSPGAWPTRRGSG